MCQGIYPTHGGLLHDMASGAVSNAAGRNATYRKFRSPKDIIKPLSAGDDRQGLLILLTLYCAGYVKENAFIE